MLLVISPSKTQKTDGPCLDEFTLPGFQPEIRGLVKKLKGFDRGGLARLMGISEKLAESTWNRFQNFSAEFNLENARQAICAFQGDVFVGIRAEKFTTDDFKFAQEHLRILSGLYGLLRPLDLIQPYRLEMKTKLSLPSAGNLYEFWDGKITGALNDDLERAGSHLVNLASREYFKVIKPALLKRPVLDIVFKVKKDGQYKVVAIHAKRARGLMVNFVIENRLVDVYDLKKFKAAGYRYNERLSGETEWVFCKD